jgi:hypothetical protein
MRINKSLTKKYVAAVRGELIAGVMARFTCGKCQAPIREDVWLCDVCWKDRESKTNRYGLVRQEGVDYACDCFASGTDEKGNKKVMAFRWNHKNNCSVFKRKTWKEKVCDCDKGSTINPDGSITVHGVNHDLACPIRKKTNKQSVEIHPFFGGYA